MFKQLFYITACLSIFCLTLPCSGDTVEGAETANDIQGEKRAVFQNVNSRIRAENLPEISDVNLSLFYLNDSHNNDTSHKNYVIEKPVDKNEPDIANELAEKKTLGLDDFLEIAFAKNQLLEVVKQQQAQSQGRLTEARSNYLPHLSLEGSYSYIEREEAAGSGEKSSRSELTVNQNEVEKDDVAHGAVKFSQLIYDFGKTTNTIKAGKKQFLASNAKLHRQIQDTIYQVKTAYYNTLEKRRLIDVARESVKSFEQHLERAILYYRAGVRTKIDVINAEVELSKAKMVLVKAEYDLKIAKAALEQVLGLQPNGGHYVLNRDEIALDDILNNMPPFPENIELLIADAMMSRPDVVEFNFLVQSAEANLKATKGDYWPSVAVQANYHDYDTELSLYKDSWEVGVVASWDIFSGLRTKGAQAQGKGRLLENRAQLQNLRLAVVREVTDSYLRAAENKEKVKIALDTLKLARENLALAEKRYESGANDVIEFNDAQLSLTRTKNDLVATYYGYLTALAEIEFSCGRLLP